MNYFFGLLNFIICDKLDDEMLNYTNEYRKSKGLKKLDVDPLLVECSRIQTEYQGRNKILSHENRDPGHENLGKRLKSVGFKFRSGAENVAYSSDINNPKDTKGTFDRLCASKGHHDNIVGNFDYVGITNCIGKDNLRYTTQVFGSKFDLPKREDVKTMEKENIKTTEKTNNDKFNGTKRKRIEDENSSSKKIQKTDSTNEETETKSTHQNPFCAQIRKILKFN